jgi:sugar phosphate isomerase/epimerase
LRESGETHLLEFLHLAAGHAKENNIHVIIEPLSRPESSTLTTFAEVVAFADRVSHPEIGVLVDFYHLEVEREPFDHIPPVGSRLLHVHVADTGRLRPGSGSYDYPGFYRALRRAGYDARISIECNWRDFPREIVPAMRFVRRSWDRSLSAG